MCGYWKGDHSGLVPRFSSQWNSSYQTARNMTENQSLHAADPFHSTRRYFLGRGMGLSLGAIACQLLGDGVGLSSAAAAAQAADAGSSTPAAGGLAGLPHFTTVDTGPKTSS